MPADGLQMRSDGGKRQRRDFATSPSQSCSLPCFPSRLLRDHPALTLAPHPSQNAASDLSSRSHFAHRSGWVRAPQPSQNTASTGRSRLHLGHAIGRMAIAHALQKSASDSLSASGGTERLLRFKAICCATCDAERRPDGGVPSSPRPTQGASSTSTHRQIGPGLSQAHLRSTTPPSVNEAAHSPFVGAEQD